MHVLDSQLNKFIIDSNLVSRADFEAALRESEKKGIRIGDILVDSGKISEDNLRCMQAHVLGISFVDLRSQKIPLETLIVIPEPIARKHNIVAFKKDEKTIEVAMLDVSDLSILDFLKKKLSHKLLPRLTDRESMKDAIIQYQKGLKAEFGNIIQKEFQALGAADDFPAARIVDTLLEHALIQNASDIHMEPHETEFVIRYRIDGQLHDAMMLPKSVETFLTARIKTLANLSVGTENLPQDGRFIADMDGEKISFRVSILPVHYGEKIVMRIIREGASGFTLEQLGFHGEGLERMHGALTKTKGIMLLTGPAASGKTTTLYTTLDILNQPGINISTIEDPVEYQMKRVNQTRVNQEIGLTFASGLRTILKQDPDVIMVGEVEDAETAVIAANAALSGRFVLSALQANGAADSIVELLSMDIAPSLLSSTLTIVVGQRLVRRLADSKEKYFLSKSEVANLAKKVDLNRVLKALHEEKIVKGIDSWDKIPFYQAVSGENNDGYKGRVGIQEVLKVTPGIKELIMKGADADEIDLQAMKEGMLTIFEDGVFKAVQGLTTIEEVFGMI